MTSAGPPPSSIRSHDGTELAVRVIRASQEPTLVWGHGLSSSMASDDAFGLIDWDVAAPGHRVVRYDARGHGDSESTTDLDDYRWDRLARDQLAIADAVSVDRYVAAGASMGCATALFAALEAPDRVDSLILVIPPTAWETRRAQIEGYETMAGLLDGGRIDVLVAGVSASPTPDPFRDEPAWNDRTRQTLRASDPTRLARVFRGAGRADLPDASAIATIDRPALVLAWTGDPGHPVSTAERLTDLLPHADLHVASTADDLASWNRRIADFLDAAPPSDRSPAR